MKTTIIQIVLLSVLMINTSCTIHKQLNYNDHKSSFPLIKEINTFGNNDRTTKYVVSTDKTRYKASKIIVYSDSTYFYLTDTLKIAKTSENILPSSFKNKYERINNSDINLIEIKNPISDSPEIITGKILIGAAGGFALGYLIGYTFTTDDETSGLRNESARNIGAIGGLLGAAIG